MASVLVHIAARGAQPSPGSAAALTTGRRIASELGATLHVAAALAAEAPSEDLIAALGRSGADKIVFLPRADPGPPRWSRTGPVLVALCRRLAPRVVLFGSGDGASDLAARLAANLGAGFLADTQLCGERREPALERFVEGRRAALRLRISALRGPLVATVAGAAGGALAAGDDDVDVRFTSEVPDGDALEWLATSADPAAALDQARVVIGVGAALDPAEVALARQLARSLGGELCGTESAWRAGLVPTERAVGLGLRSIAPELYITCATSGSRRHLAGIAPTTSIVALNRNPDAAIFRAARYAMVGDVADLVPALIRSLGATVRP